MLNSDKGVSVNMTVILLCGILLAVFTPQSVILFFYLLLVITFAKWASIDDLRSAFNAGWEWLKDHNPKWKFVASTYTGVAAVITLFFRDDIVDDSKTAWSYLKHTWGFTSIDPVIDTAAYDYSFNFLVFLYWVALVFWLAIFVIYVFAESDSNKANIQRSKDHLDQIDRQIRRHQDEINLEHKSILGDITSAIVKAPNPRVFTSYDLIFRETLDAFNTLLYYRKQVDLEAYNKLFKLVMEKICLLTQTFSRKESATYGANIMLFIRYEENKELVAKLRNERSWIHYTRLDLTFCEGALHLISDLVYANSSDRKIPNITLPVLKGVEKGKDNVLPGACGAVVHGEAVVEDVNDIEYHYSGFGGDEKNAAKKYFKDLGDDIRSFVSFAIPKSIPEAVLRKKGILNISGVLNVDCNQPDLLATDKEYYTTYFCLVRPIISHFSLFLDHYLKLYLDEQDKKNVANSTKSA